jgi:hypothetical protein
MGPYPTIAQNLDGEDVFVVTVRISATDHSTVLFLDHLSDSQPLSRTDGEKSWDKYPLRGILLERLFRMKENRYDSPTLHNKTNICKLK